MRRLHCLLIGAIVVAVSAFGDELTAKQKQAAIAYAKNLPVGEIEPELGKSHLSEWLRDVLGASSLEWFISGCDLKPEGWTASQTPLCVGAKVAPTDPVYIRFHLVVGNWSEGISGKPSVALQSFIACNRNGREDVEDSFVAFGVLRKLPEFVAYVRKTCAAKR